MYESFVKVSRTYTVPSNDYNPPIQESVMGFASSMQKNMEGLAAASAKMTGMGSSSSIPRSGSAEAEIPKSLSHALSKVANDQSVLFSPEEPLGVALSKIAATHNRVGNAKVRMDEDVVAKFYDPCLSTLNQTIAMAMVLADLFI
jgi:hypothetical protein